MRSWAHWTTTEILKLKEAHKHRVPSLGELSVMFPRHSTEGIRQAAIIHNLRPKQRNWFKISHQYFVDRK